MRKWDSLCLFVEERHIHVAQNQSEVQPAEAAENSSKTQTRNRSRGGESTRSSLAEKLPSQRKSWFFLSWTSPFHPWPPGPLHLIWDLDDFLYIWTQKHLCCYVIFNFNCPINNRNPKPGCDGCSAPCGPGARVISDLLSQRAGQIFQPFPLTGYCRSTTVLQFCDFLQFLLVQTVSVLEKSRDMMDVNVPQSLSYK